MTFVKYPRTIISLLYLYDFVFMKNQVTNLTWGNAAFVRFGSQWFDLIS